MFEGEIVALVVCAGVWLWRCEAIDAHGAIVAGGSKVLVGGVECDALDMTLVLGESLELFKGVARPYDDLRVETDGDEDGRIVRPGEILNVVVVADQAAVDAPVFDGWCLI